MTIFLNGRRLEDLARRVEMPHAVAEGKPNLAGDYEPLALPTSAPIPLTSSVTLERPG